MRLARLTRQPQYIDRNNKPLWIIVFNLSISTIIYYSLLRKLSLTFTTLVLCTDPPVSIDYYLIRENQLLSFNTGYLIVSYLSPFTL
jgi:hypothetical protein